MKYKIKCLICMLLCFCVLLQSFIGLSLINESVITTKAEETEDEKTMNKSTIVWAKTCPVTGASPIRIGCITCSVCKMGSSDVF